MSEDDEMPETCEDAFDRLEAEVIRLRALVESAYEEGWDERDVRDGNAWALPAVVWLESESYKALGGPRE